MVDQKPSDIFSITSILKDDGRKQQQQSSSSGKKRSRTIFTSDQLQKMEEHFLKQQYIVGDDRTMLAKELCLTELQVKVWFQNRRIKWRKHTLEKEQTSLNVLSSESSSRPEIQVDWLF